VELPDLITKAKEKGDSHLVLCLNQIFRPPKIGGVKMIGEGMGDCSICSYDPYNNGKCAGFQPVAIGYFEVKKRQPPMYVKGPVREQYDERREPVMDLL
jgi:hypothetical protein